MIGARARAARPPRARDRARARARMSRAYMDALGVASSDSDDDDEDDVDVLARRAHRADARAHAIDYESLRRNGLRETTLGRAPDATATRTAWCDGASRERDVSTYWGSESAKTRDAVGEGLRETCARALDAARDAARARDEELARRREETARAKERYLDAKQALREDELVRRRREREENVAGDGVEAKRSRRAPRIDVSTRGVTAADDEKVVEDGEDDAVARETAEKRLVETGGFDFGDEE